MKMVYAWAMTLIRAGRPVSSGIVAVFTVALLSVGIGVFKMSYIRPTATMFFLTTFGFLINDIFDIEKDRAGGVDRPIAKGSISPRTGAWMAVGCFVLATALSPHESRAYAILFAAFAALLAYSPLVSVIPIVKGLYTAVLCCAPLAYGAAIVHLPIPVIAYIALVGFILGREFYMDGVEIEIDRAAGMRTIAAVLGSPTTKRVGIVLMVLGSITCTVIANGIRGQAIGALAALGIASVFAWPNMDDNWRVSWSRLPMLFAAIALATTIGH
jgi:4-hydroxybenzoate polyprenyltransferase